MCFSVRSGATGGPTLSQSRLLPSAHTCTSSRQSWRLGLGLALLTLLLGWGGLRAEEPSDLREMIELQRKQIEQQQKQLEEQKRQLDALARRLDGVQVGTSGTNQMAAPVEESGVKKIITEYLKDNPGAAPDPSHVDVAFKNGASLWVTTASGDFTFHPGIWIQYDNIFWTQSPQLTAVQGARAGPKQGVASGANLGGIGDEQDGTDFRRVRPFIEGTMWGNFEYRFVVDMENVQFSQVELDEFWAGLNNIPIIGTIRVGHIKNLLGIEGDEASSSRSMTFMERSSYSEAIELNQNFFTGVEFTRTYLEDKRGYIGVGVFRTDIASTTGTLYGDGQWGSQARLTVLPIYEDKGAEMMHLGLSGGWRQGTNNITGANGAAATNYRTFTLSARPELRDDDPAASPAGAQVLPNVDDNRMVSTGAIAASNAFLLGSEFLYIRGPFSVQGEYGANFLQNCTGIAPTGFTFNPILNPSQNYVFTGGYIQLAYTLTGESRGPGYDRTRGAFGRYYLGEEGPTRPLWLTRDGIHNLGWGAWEIAARYSYLNLNDGTGVNRIQGGDMQGVSLALNWYLNTNSTLMFDWVYNDRYNLPTGSFSGYTQGLGARMQISF